jgi:hypothetical protein
LRQPIAKEILARALYRMKEKGELLFERPEYCPEGYEPSWIHGMKDTSDTPSPQSLPWPRRGAAILPPTASSRQGQSSSRPTALAELEVELEGDSNDVIHINEDPSLFAIFLEWLYSPTDYLQSTIQDKAGEKELLVDLYCLAERLEISDLRQQCYVFLRQECAGPDALPGMELIAIVIKQCEPEVLLRKFVVAKLAYAMVKGGYKQEYNELVDSDEVFKAQVAEETMLLFRAGDKTKSPHEEEKYDMDDSDSDVYYSGSGTDSELDSDHCFSGSDHDDVDSLSNSDHGEEPAIQPAIQPMIVPEGETVDSDDPDEELEVIIPKSKRTAPNAQKGVKGQRNGVTGKVVQQAAANLSEIDTPRDSLEDSDSEHEINVAAAKLAPISNTNPLRSNVSRAATTSNSKHPIFKIIKQEKTADEQAEEARMEFLRRQAVGNPPSSSGAFLSTLPKNLLANPAVQQVPFAGPSRSQPARLQRHSSGIAVPEPSRSQPSRIGSSGSVYIKPEPLPPNISDIEVLQPTSQNTRSPRAKPATTKPASSKSSSARASQSSTTSTPAPPSTQSRNPPHTQASPAPASQGTPSTKRKRADTSSRNEREGTRRTCSARTKSPSLPSYEEMIAGFDARRSVVPGAGMGT